jgi:hypothetical protein
MGCRSIWLQKVTVGYRQHDRSTTRDALKQAEYLLLVLEAFFARPDLPESIQQLETQIRYTTLVWIAWYQYRTGYYAEMEKYLRHSLNYTPFLRAETISDWMSQFNAFSLESGVRLDCCLLNDLPEWQNLLLPTVYR